MKAQAPCILAIPPLERLFTLLETGATQSIRKSAATQIGEISRLRPQEIFAILEKLKPYLFNSSWDTRIAAGLALDTVISNVSSWNPDGNSSGSSQTISDQKASLNKHICGGQPALSGPLDIFCSEFVSEEDFIDTTDFSSFKMRSSTELQEELFGKTHIIHEADNGYSSQCMTKKLKISNTDFVYSSTLNDSAWFLQPYVDWLIESIFDYQWEKRHGALLGLKGFLRHHGRNLGKSAQLNMQDNAELNGKFLEDLCIRLLSLVILDRFADYVSDEVVAPVRESCAQVLAITCTLIDEGLNTHVLSLLKALIKSRQWEVRHGSLLCLKYIVPSCKYARDNAESYICAIFPSFDDGDTDVISTACSCLLPVEETVVKVLGDRLVGFAEKLEVILGSFNDLNASSSLISLLSRLLRHINNNGLKECILNRLYNCLRHPNPQVRFKTMESIRSILPNLNTDESDISSIVEKCMRQIYRALLFESEIEVLEECESTWNLILSTFEPSVLLHVVCQTFSALIYPILISSYMQVNENILLNDEPGTCPNSDKTEYLGSSSVLNCKPRERDTLAMRNRIRASKCVGRLLAAAENTNNVPNAPMMFANYLASNTIFTSANHRIGFSLIVNEWAMQSKNKLPSVIHEKVISCLGDRPLFDELTGYVATAQRSCRTLVAVLKRVIPSVRVKSDNEIYNFDEIRALCSECESKILAMPSSEKQSIEVMKDNLLELISRATMDQDLHNIRTSATISSCAVHINALSEKLNPVIKPLMDSLRRDTNIYFQKIAAEALAKLLRLTSDRAVRPHAKLMKNLATYLCSSSAQTPRINDLPSEVPENPDVSNGYACSKFKGIISLTQMEEEVCNPSKSFVTSSVENSEWLMCDPNVEPEISCRGATTAIEYFCLEFKDEIFEKVSELKDLCIAYTKLLTDDGGYLTIDRAQEVIVSLRFFETVIDYIAPSCLEKIIDAVEIMILKGISNSYSAIRHMCARTLAAAASRMPEKIIGLFEEKMLSSMKLAPNKIVSQGVIETMHHIIIRLDTRIVDFAHILCIPVLRFTSNQDWYVRLLANRCFAILVKLYPLRNQEITPNNKDSMFFLDQLLNPSRMRNYKLPFELNFNLRPYQQDGINWLFFLRNYNLNGILCDDMGLGKTLQTLCLIVGNFLESKTHDKYPLPNLVACPSTVTRHWVYEIEKFFKDINFKPLLYTGSMADREQIQNDFIQNVNKYQIIVTSYELIRSDIAFFSTVEFCYFVLDEGHIIRRSKTKLSQAVKRISAQHRLILSGYLGTEKQFNIRYGRPVLQSKESKTSKEQEIGIIALGALHKQVLPFMMRRMKHDVLDYLPPKIIQDYYCDLTTIQMMLYDDFCSQHELDMNELEGGKKPEHIFQALQYLRKLCNHPMLVCSDTHSKWNVIKAELCKSGCNLADIQNSGKLLALRDLLLECGVGESMSCSITPAQQHRILIFCQMKITIKLIETLVLSEMKDVKYLCLDGSVPQSKRFDIVQRFNSDNSINLLLLTTQVGGLGLTLTGADVVIFIEHDWNPSKDLQAMDRAHRLGQTRTVNVYRLITKGTLEEKIMNLQKFKMNIANTVISSENSSTASMQGSLIDLFSFDNASKEKKKSGIEEKCSRKENLKNLLDRIGHLWDENAYNEEYDIDSFKNSLKETISNN